MGGETHVVVVARDITDRLAAEEKIHAADQELNRHADRERIARDLHDTVIQRLFAAGMTLQAAAKASPEVEQRVERVIDELDATIRDIRQTIFHLTSHSLAPSSLRRRIVAVVEQEEEALGFAPHLRFDGAVETVDELRAADLLAVVREALSNVGRHAGATAVEVTVAVGSEISVTVEDDGTGFPVEIATGEGLANMGQRAELRGGHCSIEARSPRGLPCVGQCPPARSPRPDTGEAPSVPGRRASPRQTTADPGIGRAPRPGRCTIAWGRGQAERQRGTVRVRSSKRTG